MQRSNSIFGKIGIDLPEKRPSFSCLKVVCQYYSIVLLLLLAYAELTEPSDGIFTCRMKCLKPTREFRQWTFIDNMQRHCLLAATGSEWVVSYVPHMQRSSTDTVTSTISVEYSTIQLYRRKVLPSDECTAAPVRRICSSVRQFLIHSTLVHIILCSKPDRKSALRKTEVGLIEVGLSESYNNNQGL